MKPICVYSAPRTGSTALTADLASKYCIPNLSEIFNNNYLMPTQRAKDMFRTEQSFVWAFKPSQRTTKNTHIVDRYLNASTIVKITRRDLVKQIASFYFMVKTKPLDHCVDQILKYNKIVDELTPVDEHVIYEDYTYTDTCGVLPQAKPDNYTQICNQVSTLLGELNV